MKKANKDIPFTRLSLKDLGLETSSDPARERPEVGEQLSVCPTEPGVYVMKDELDHIIYVGKAKNLRNRVRSYFQAQANHSAKTAHLVSKVRSLEFVRTATETEALLLENNFIKKWKPKYNIRLKDDKTYPYLKLDLHHPFPRPYISRKQSKGDGNEYFGPFPMSGALRASLSAAAKLFLLRDCRDHEFANRSRPCLSFEIGQCTAPCVGLVTTQAYAGQVDEFRAFLKGEKREVEGRWREEMETAAEALDFERAARLRDRLAAIDTTVGQDQRTVDMDDHTDRDFWAVCPDPSGEGDSDLDVLILQFRQGKWVGQLHRTADISQGLETEDWLATLLLEHYTKHVLPKEIVLSPHARIPEAYEFAKALLQVSAISRTVNGDQTEAPDVRRASDQGRWAKTWEMALANVHELHAQTELLRNRKEDGLAAIAKMLDLPKTPIEMDCVDISNFQGEANVASAVVFRRGKPEKSLYRHYKIAGFTGQDDFASMREVMSRRYGKPDSPQPDLLVIDGGKGQLASAVEILKSLGLNFPVVGLAKARTVSNYKSEEVEASEERLFLPGQKNFVKIRNAEALKILTHLRDEAHRFAIEFHRLKRSQARGLE